MEDNGTREQTGALPLEGSFPEAVPGTVGESHIRKGNAVFSVPSGTEKFPERESEREEYWNSVLTGDVMTIPREVRLKAEAMYPEGTADRERIAACVMQSWVADSGAIPRERIRRDWKSIREQVARQYDELISYADLYDSANFEAKKMIVNQLIRRVDVYRGYQINISFNFDLTPYIEGE